MKHHLQIDKTFFAFYLQELKKTEENDDDFDLEASFNEATEKQRKRKKKGVWSVFAQEFVDRILWRE